MVVDRSLSFVPRGLVLCVLAGMMVGMMVGAGPQRAEAAKRVPTIYTEDLPVAGTCAPLRTENVTHVMVGRSDEWGSFRVGGERGARDAASLLELLKVRGKVPGHSLWITASAKHRWGHVVQVRLMAQRAGIFRLGLRVRHEGTGKVYGFPLFLPHKGADDVMGKRGAKLPVRLRTVLDKAADLTRDEKRKRGLSKPERASNLKFAYRAAQLAVEKAAKEGLGPVVAVCRFAHNCELQDAVSVMDYMRRGGCVGIRTIIGALPASPKIQVLSILHVQGVVASSGEYDGKIPPIKPRTEPWPDHGANAPEAFSLVLQDLPAATKRAATPRVPRPELRKVSTFQQQKASAQIRSWAEDLKAAFDAALDKSPTLVGHVAKAKRVPGEYEKVIAPMKEVFPAAQRIVPSTLALDVIFSNGGSAVARLDASITVGGGEPSFLFVNWHKATEADQRAVLDDANDPFTEGTAEAIRTWLVAAFQALRRPKDPKGLPMTSTAGAMSFLPASSHKAAASSLAKRVASFRLAGQNIRALPYDRISLRLRHGMASIVEADKVAGLLFLDWAVEGGELRITRMRARRGKTGRKASAPR